MQYVIHGHRTLKAPHPVRSAQLTRVPPSQYHGGGPRGNPGCCGFFFFLFFSFFRSPGGGTQSVVTFIQQAGTGFIYCCYFFGLLSKACLLFFPMFESEGKSIIIPPRQNTQSKGLFLDFDFLCFISTSSVKGLVRFRLFMLLKACL